MIETLERFARFEGELPEDTSELSQRERAGLLARFMDREPNPQAVQDAVAVLAAERNSNWNTGQSTWRGLVVLTFPEIASDRRRLGELTKVLEATAGHPPSKALAIIKEGGGVSTLGKRPALNLELFVRRTERRPQAAFRRRSTPRD